ncbi:PTS lactose/cellobiose transporter subunit IIA [Enterococcus casseliflavus]|uniref:PTS lactose/cellobiose transporter subunit IIA n=1 Tax=Enterococcus casseliflavus TaxID=37734 RepID=UPI003D0AFEBE
MNQEQLEAVMGLIIHSGNAKSDAMEAITAAKEGNFEQADQQVKQAEEAIVEAHHAQTSMLTNEAQGNAAEITLLTIHSQDHLMTAIAFCDLTKEIIELHKRITSAIT